MSLTDIALVNAEPGAKPYKMADGKGMFILVSPAGGKWWRLKYRFGGKEKQLTLGVYPDVSIADARIRRDTYRALLAEGIDPSEHAKMEKASQRAERERQIAATRFILDNDGALSFRFGTRRMILTPAETSELRTFLDATRSVIPKDIRCR
jgi:hypothetical protein